MNEHISLISLSWNEAIISFSLHHLSKVRVESILPSKSFLAETTEENRLGRIHLNKLSPMSKYKIKVKWRKNSRQIQFTTLPEPVGPLLSSFAVVADPHISEKTENRKGRLFVESTSILREMVEEFNADKLDFVLIAGDLTNNSTEEEYSAAKRTLVCGTYAKHDDPLWHEDAVK